MGAEKSAMKGGIITFQKFSHYPEIVQGFSTSYLGNLQIKDNFQNDQNLNVFLRKLRVKKGELVRAEQVHGKEVAVVGRKEQGTVVSGIDGFLTKEEGIYLVVNVADCLPIFFYDPGQKIIALAHSGWRGTLQEIAGKVIFKVMKLGSRAQDIRVAIGPHIKVCCYDVSEDRVRLFEEKFGQDTKIVKAKNEKFYLDLTYLNLKQLTDMGVKRKNIEISPFCTSCASQMFFSYRHQKSGNISAMMGLIGRRK